MLPAHPYTSVALLLPLPGICRGTPQTPGRPAARPTSAQLPGRGSPQPSPFAYVRAFDALRLRFHVKKVLLKIMFIVKKNNVCII